MKTVHKYTLQHADAQTIDIPKGAQVLKIAQQYGEQVAGPIQVWALVDTEAPMERRTFWIFGTGHEIPTIALQPHLLLTYIDTITQAGGRLMWHVFQSRCP